MKVDINDLTLGQLKEIAAMTPIQSNPIEIMSAEIQDGLNCFIGEMVIIRTYSAGVWFGKLEQKSGDEVIISSARRMYRWWASESISLSAVALHGIKQDKSKICESLPKQWLKAIEIIPCSSVAIKSLSEAPIVKAQ